MAATTTAIDKAVFAAGAILDQILFPCPVRAKRLEWLPVGFHFAEKLRRPTGNPESTRGRLTTVEPKRQMGWS